MRQKVAREDPRQRHLREAFQTNLKPTLLIEPVVFTILETRPYTRQRQSRTAGQGRLFDENFSTVTDQRTERPTHRLYSIV